MLFIPCFSPCLATVPTGWRLQMSPSLGSGICSIIPLFFQAEW